MTEADMWEAPIRAGSDHERRYPGASKLATECAVNIARTENLLFGEVMQVLRRFGLTTATFNVLMILDGAGEPLCPYQIGERLLVTRGTVTGLLDSLEKRGLVRRIAHPDDRRMLLIELTDRARILLKAVWREHFPAETELLSALTDREKETLIRLLGKLQVHLRDRAGGAALAG